MKPGKESTGNALPPMPPEEYRVGTAGGTAELTGEASIVSCQMAETKPTPLRVQFHSPTPMGVPGEEPQCTYALNWRKPPPHKAPTEFQYHKPYTNGGEGGFFFSQPKCYGVRWRRQRKEKDRYLAQLGATANTLYSNSANAPTSAQPGSPTARPTRQKTHVTNEGTPLPLRSQSSSFGDGHLKTLLAPEEGRKTQESEFCSHSRLFAAELYYFVSPSTTPTPIGASINHSGHQPPEQQSIPDACLVHVPATHWVHHHSITTRRKWNRVNK